MKFLLCAALSLLAPTFALAQAAAPKESSKAAAKPAASAASKPASKPSASKPSASRTEIRSTAKQMAAGIEAAEAALSAVELEIAERVHVGRLPCELGSAVAIEADPKAPGYFNLQIRNLKYRMNAVPTTTGAIRLEDQKAGAVWLQLANKSMLMNQKLGQRLADECMSPQQMAVSEAMKAAPPQSVLDAPAPAATPASAASAAAPEAAASAAK
ncbi:MAG TPA: hypothetical protein VLJ57_13725 [Burkholderiaceae bacterium]|nr:hypothetical protein [Burkholderiaceae bacterium]